MKARPCSRRSRPRQRLSSATHEDWRFRRFGAVLLGSHLVNGVDGAGPACLRVARSLRASDGVVVAEVYPPGFDWAAAIGRG